MDIRPIMSGQRRDPLARLLRMATRVAAIPYGVATTLRNRKYDRDASSIQHADVPVISVGNITTGGTGKSPMVAWIARVLRNEGLRVAIVSRGYGADASGVNDEALELEERLPDVPHVQNPDRVEGARVVVEELETEVILLDDGFQHRRLHRDLDIVLIDASCPFGYGYQLPRGMLRESLKGLKRADVVVLTRSDAASDADRRQIRESVQRFAATATWVESVHAPSALLTHAADPLPIETLRGQQVLVFSAIGNPDAFVKTVTDCGATLIDSKTFPDHHRFDREDIETLTAWVDQHPAAEAILCTHKDLVKLRTSRIGRLPLRAVGIKIAMTVGESELRQRLLQTARQATS
ncbi:tetraacyldisaccharide 4'-kinase [Rosistilla oblonga]|uniref:Tetraacyldisaccharide 4'-kinase n=1 Tax=Rosistilla oblonga TaxID=2527990 RepID=A0A518IPC4_9BACT|nr:tetraacyldisaccharide 4'-kinase [Rosistilla oblonga]QDV54940.1 Tetraacyldisaccharide 4'-kinase [Rosistilla oblonga]